MNDDLISRQAAQTELMMQCERYTLSREESNGIVGHVEWSSDLISVADAMDAIRDLPSAQRTGRWEVTPVYIKCSECGESFMLIPQNFCPNCGADMRGESDE